MPEMEKAKTNYFPLGKYSFSHKMNVTTEISGRFLMSVNGVRFRINALGLEWGINLHFT